MINKVIWFFFWWISQNPKCQQSIIYLCSKFKPQTTQALDSIQDLNFMLGIQTKVQPWLLIKKFIFHFFISFTKTDFNKHAGYKWVYLLKFECQVRYYKKKWTNTASESIQCKNTGQPFKVDISLVIAV